MTSFNKFIWTTILISICRFSLADVDVPMPRMTQKRIDDIKAEYVNKKQNIDNIKKTSLMSPNVVIIGESEADFLMLKDIQNATLIEKEKIYKYLAKKYYEKLKPEHVKYLRLDTAFVDRSTNYIFVGILNQDEVVPIINRYGGLDSEYKNFINNFFYEDRASAKKSNEYDYKNVYKNFKAVKTEFDIKHEQAHKEFGNLSLNKSECVLLISQEYCNEIDVESKFNNELFNEAVADISALQKMQTRQALMLAAMSRAYYKETHPKKNDIHDTYYGLWSFMSQPASGLDQKMAAKKHAYLSILYKQKFSDLDGVFINGLKSDFVNEVGLSIKDSITPSHLKTKK